MAVFHIRLVSTQSAEAMSHFKCIDLLRRIQARYAHLEDFVKKTLFCIACVSLALALTGCTTGMNTIGSVQPYALDLVKMDYDVLGETTAEATRTAVIGIDWAHLFNDNGAPVADGSILGTVSSLLPSYLSPLNGAKAEANLASLKKVPNADRLVDPRYEIKTYNLLGIYQKVTVKVTAKAVKYTKSAPTAK
jgi:hypothetical protein